MSKKCEVKSCRDCPHMYHEYYDYDGECALLDRVIKYEIDIYTEIHPECPLSDWEE